MKFEIMRLTPYKRNAGGGIHSKGKRKTVDDEDSLLSYLKETIPTLLCGEKLMIKCFDLL